MTKLETIFKKAQELSPLEKLNLIGALSESLQHYYKQMQLMTDFWQPQTLEQHIQAQQTQNIADISSLRASFWPEEESADDIIEFVYQQRKEDNLRN